MCVRVVCMFGHVWLFAAPWTADSQAPLYMDFSRQEYWSGLPFSSPWDLLNPVTEPTSLVSSALAGRFFTTMPPGKFCRSLVTSRRLYTWTSLDGQHWNQIVIAFAAKNGALYSQQKQDWELTVAQVMNSWLPNSDLNWRKWGKPLNHSGMT